MVDWLGMYATAFSALCDAAGYAADQRGYDSLNERRASILYHRDEEGKKEAQELYPAEYAIIKASNEHLKAGWEARQSPRPTDQQSGENKIYAAEIEDKELSDSHWNAVINGEIKTPVAPIPLDGLGVDAKLFASTWNQGGDLKMVCDVLGVSRTGLVRLELIKHITNL